VKRLRSNIPDNALVKFLSEVRILEGLKNDFIVNYLGSVFEKDNLCIVTDFYSGGTLWEKIHDSSALFTMAFVHKICLEISSAVRYLHYECIPPIIHRDLKSPNVLLTADLTVKVADFGLARILQPDDTVMTGGIGTTSWTAPEVLRSQSYSEKADVYSFAVIVWELFARIPPFHPMERDQILLAVVVDDARPAMPANIPVVWKSFIENCWQRDPKERPDFREIVSWLVEFPTKNPQAFAPPGK
jgi:serine/threonine protein kinase